MEKYDTLIKVHVCGQTQQQRDKAVRTIRRLTVGGNVTVTSGYWYDYQEQDLVVSHWLDSDQDQGKFTARLVRVLKVYQQYAAQEAIFIEYFSPVESAAVVVYPGDWQAVEERLQWVCNHTERLLQFFQGE